MKHDDIRILVVDDDPAVLAGHVRLLEQAGYVVERAIDGETALQAVRDRRPDLLLLDRNLPGIDGLEVCRQIKRDPALADILVVIASGSSAATDQQSEGLEGGADGYIPCPVPNRELLARVEAFVRIVLLSRALRRREAEAQTATTTAVKSSDASLNLMEDAIEAQRRLEVTNQQLRGEIAERVRAEASLLLNTAALTAAANAIVITSRAGAIVWANAAFTSLTGYTLAEATGKNPRELIKSGRHDRVFYQQMWATILAGKVWRGELFNRRKNGNLYPEEMTITPVRATGGEITHFIAIKQDLTERKRAEAVLERTNRILHVVSSGNEALVHASEEPKLMQKICRIAVEVGGYRMAWVGYAEGDEAKTVRPVACAGIEEGYLTSANISWGDNESGSGPTGLAIRTGRPEICQNLREDPHMARWREAAHARGYEASIALPLLLDGRVFGALTIYAEETDAFNPAEAKLLGNLCEDLSYGIANLRAHRAREESAAALHASEERYRLLFEDNPLPMWLYDDQTLAFIAVNGTAVRNYGYSHEEFLRLTVKQIVPDEDVDALLRSMDRPTNQPGIGERRHRRKDGSIIPVEVVSRPLTFNGRSAHLVLASDITEKKLLEDKFLHAQRLESIGMLAAGIAHDLNNVLAPIVFAAPMLRENLSSARDLKIINTLEASASRGAGLVKQILGFVHSTSSEFIPTQVKHLARDIVSVIEETFPKSITFEHHVPTNLWTVQGNATQIHQVLLNLCVNARDAMPQGGTLTFAIANRHLTDAEAALIADARAGDWLLIEVRDTGTGMAPEVLEHIWTPFFTTKGVGKGTGLGLTTVRSIVISHGGFIDLQTAVGRGASFRVYLPAIDIASASPAAGAVAALPRGQAEEILVVDDDAVLLDIIVATLEKQGYRTVACANGADGLAKFTAQPDKFSLVITDVDMPRLDGVTLAREILKLRPTFPIIGMSGFSSEGKGAAGNPTLRQLTRAFLRKPYSSLDLLTTVHELLHPSAKP